MIENCKVDLPHINRNIFKVIGWRNYMRKCCQKQEKESYILEFQHNFVENWKNGILWPISDHQKLPGRKVNCHKSKLRCQPNSGVECLSVVEIRLSLRSLGSQDPTTHDDWESRMQMRKWKKCAWVEVLQALLLSVKNIPSTLP